MTGRLDARLEPLGDGLLLRSSVEPALAVAAIVSEPDPLRMGWTPCVQVPSIDAITAFAEAAGAASITDTGIPAGAPGTRAVELVDPAGARVIVIQHGPRHGRR